MLRAPTWVRGRLLGLGVCAALVTALAAAAPALARDEAPDPFAQALVEVADLLADAHFRTARSVAEAHLADSTSDALDAGSRASRARLHVLLATAHVALGAGRAADENLLQALSLDPDLALDESTTTPKLLRRLQGLRQEDVGAASP